MTDTTVLYTMSEAKPKLYSKISNLRAMIMKCDWTKDKRMVGIATYPYLSVGKVKQNFAPLFAKAGLEIDMSYGEPKQLEMVETRNSRMQHWLIELRVSFIDVETGLRTEPMSYWGEGTDPLDKGLRKAMTAAIKSWLTDLFCIEEGIDPELNGSDESASFNPKANEPEIKSKIADAAVKPKTQVPKPKKAEEPVKAETEVIAEEIKEVAETVKEAAKPPRTKKEAEPKGETAVPAKSAEPAQKPVVAPSTGAGDIIPGSDTGYKVTGVQEKPLEKIIKEWQTAHTEGKIRSEKFEEMAAACRAIGDNRAVMQFIVKYRKVE